MSTSVGTDVSVEAHPSLSLHGMPYTVPVHMEYVTWWRHSINMTETRVTICYMSE